MTNTALDTRFFTSLTVELMPIVMRIALISTQKKYLSATAWLIFPIQYAQ